MIAVGYVKSFPGNKCLNITKSNVCCLFKSKNIGRQVLTHLFLEWLLLQSDHEHTADKYVVCLHDVTEVYFK